MKYALQDLIPTGRKVPPMRVVMLPAMSDEQKDAKVRELMAAASTGQVSITFTKKTTGELRHINGLLKVAKYVKGTGNPSDKVIRIWSPAAGKEEMAYRSFSPVSAHRICVNHTDYFFSQDIAS